MTNSGRAFTIIANGLARVLVTLVKVGIAFNPDTSPSPEGKEYDGIWDTGATASVVTERVVTECGLKQIGIVEAHGVDGKYLTEVYLMSLRVPNGVGWPFMKVTKGKLPPGADVLIGMDIISRGDFAVTNFQGKTAFSFRWPSMERIDFTGKSQLVDKPPLSSGPSSIPKVGRNDPCPCGSGKKYKKCHGSANPPQ
jgi:hypothetical protein